MSRSVEFAVKSSPVHKKGATGKNIYSAIASTDALDRDREILIPKGVMVEQFMKNPVMLNIHDRRKLPVGRVLGLSVSEDAVKFDFEFNDDPESARIEKLYENNFMNAFSVGFIPKAYIPTYDLEDNVSSLDVTLPDGSTHTVDFTKYADRPYGIIPKWELLEISPVPVPSNPEALMIRATDGITRKYAEMGKSKAAAEIVSTALSHQLKALTSQMDDLLKEITEGQVSTLSNVVPYQKCEGLDETPFDVLMALADLAKFASSDHSGEKDTLSWFEFARGFAWLDVEKADTFTGYKFLHHTIKGDALQTSKSGVTAAMAALLGQEKSSVIPKDHRQGVYDHLAAHYEEFGLKAPAFDQTYSEDQLKLIAEGKEPIVEVTEPTPEPEQTPSDVKELLDSMTATIGERLTELDTSVKVRLQLLTRMLEEIHADVLRLPTAPKSAESDEPDSDVEAQRQIAVQLSGLKDLFKDVKFQ